MKNNIKTLIIGLIIFNFFSCQNSHSQFIKGSGNVIKTDRPVSSFQVVEVQDGIDLYITQNNSESLQVEADENLHQYIKTEIEQGVLKIYLSKIIWKSQVIKVHLSIKNITGLSASGGSDVESIGVLNLEELSVICSGGSDAKLNVNVDKLKFKASGGSDGYLSGTAKSFLGKASGGSDILAFDLNAVDCYVEVNGGSDAEVNVSGILNASGSGGSDISYKGTPSSIDSNMSGGSDLNHE
jgi:hypothetical protein